MDNDAEKANLNSWWQGFLTGLVLGFFVATYFVGSINNKHWNDVTRGFVQTQPAVSLSPAEAASLTNAKAAYSMGDARPLNLWLEKLAKQSRWGRLPSLPAEYSNDLAFEFEGDLILLPRPARE